MMCFVSSCVRKFLGTVCVAAVWMATEPVLQAQSFPLVQTTPDEGLSDHVNTLMQSAMQEGDFPGAVVVMASSDAILFADAYGDRQQEPTHEPMTLDTIFDLASLTKPVATATSVMILIEEGRVAPDDKVHVASAKDNDTEVATSVVHPDMRLEHLLLHTSGLIPDNAMSDYTDGPDSVWKKIGSLAPRTPPGQKFAYSDVGFMRLQQIVERASGESLDAFSRRRIFEPLGMTDTHYRPAKKFWPRIAPTEKQDDRFLRGTVHDPRAAALGGVAGHAGLFSSANDLVKYGRMMLRRGRPVLSVTAWQTMSRPRDVGRGTRTYGWDHRSPYSSNRPAGFSDAAFGHGGFTGTVLWIDPEKNLVFVFLSNRLHPDGKGSVNALAAKVGNVLLTHLEKSEKESD